MRRPVRAALAAATGALLAAAAVPASAAETTAAGPAAVEWSARHGTATAAGERWTESTGTGFFRVLVLDGELINTGGECYSVWTRFVYDLAPAPARKQAEICGPGTTGVEVRQSYLPTTTGSLAVCRGTTGTADCGAWQSITWWPVSRD
ncbi:hypothetical protein V1L54_02695 [Streptomyces sp. TRM 70361]|uniref:hypothetical protein n=1 Tax=Streptomyces sp. TRM 70361 TaxID=3116553 RepID=UPI002E7AD545|nr:hypothetical protein [Streptomyces sp. TRM 70361]MEE1938329.1 hypothetical protein [Streptomyces sp. TRM 70361]